jgi:hypothetical protein
MITLYPTDFGQHARPHFRVAHGLAAVPCFPDVRAGFGEDLPCCFRAFGELGDIASALLIAGLRGLIDLRFQPLDREGLLR